MRQICLNLDKTQQRPVIMLHNLTALLDTGAYIPVWTDDEAILKTMFNAEFVMPDAPLKGFGGETRGNLYRVTLSVGDLIFPNMPIIASNELSTPFNLILSATMFSNLIYEIDDKNHKLNITIPDDEGITRNLNIADSNGKLYVLCNSDKVSNDEIVKDIAAGFRNLLGNKK